MDPIGVILPASLHWHSLALLLAVAGTLLIALKNIHLRRRLTHVHPQPDGALSTPKPFRRPDELVRR